MGCWGEELVSNLIQIPQTYFHTFQVVMGPRRSAKSHPKKPRTYRPGMAREQTRVSNSNKEGIGFLSYITYGNIGFLITHAQNPGYKGHEILFVWFYDHPL
jgi:hypothetical protein